MLGSNFKHSKSFAGFFRQRKQPLRTVACCLLLTVSLGLTACASAPVQAMSNARQAIRAAQDAGAAQVAPAALGEAQGLLNRAESNLNRRFFRAARNDAERAHAKAVEALELSRAEKKT